MDAYDQIKRARQEEIKLDPPPFHMELSTPTPLDQADRVHRPEARMCKVYYEEELIEYKRKIVKRVRERLSNEGLDIQVDIEQEEDLLLLEEKYFRINNGIPERRKVTLVRTRDSIMGKCGEEVRAITYEELMNNNE